MKKRIVIFWRKVLPIFLTLFSVTLLTVISMMYAKGYRVNIGDFKNVDNLNPRPSLAINIQKTGILAVRSVPDAAKIYINDNLVDTTNATISSLVPGTYKVKVLKEGFETWEKQVEVFDDKVTDITALLVLKGGGLNPITNTGVSEFQISNRGDTLAFTSKGEAKPGLYLIQLSNSPINIFQSQKKAIVVDDLYPYSDAKYIKWSPSDQEILIKINDTTYYLVDINKPANQDPVVLNTDIEILLSWEQENIKNKVTSAESLNVSGEYLSLAISSDSVWSPDGEKFYIIKQDSQERDIYTVTVYNFENPLPVSETVVNTGVKYTGSDTNVFWYSDSKHLLIVTKEKVKLVHIDGTNLYEVFSGEVIGKKAFSAPFGDKILILTKFKTEGTANLYGVSIR